jgi:quercetin dioxygenase-like cupin family protein
MADSNTPRIQAHHVTDALIEVDLVAELDALQASDSYQTADHAARTIAKHPGIRVVLIALKPGGQIHEHHADSAITVQGVQGRVEFRVGEPKAELVPGVLLTVAAGRPHSVVGVDQCALILTIGGSHGPS